MAFVRFLLLVTSLLACGYAAFKFAHLFINWLGTRIKRRHSIKAREKCDSNNNTFAKQLEDRLQGYAPLAKLIDKHKQARYAKRLRSEMPEAVRLLCIALDSGSSLVRALDFAARNCNEPLAYELKRCVWDLEAGQGFGEAMQHLRSRTGGSEFAYLAVAMEIQHSSGGSMSEILASVSDALRQNIEMEEKLETKTTQARLSSRVVAIMPIALLLVISLFSPGYLGSFFSSPLGIVLFILAILLEVIGIVLVRRFLRIDLNAHAGSEAL